jgi:L-lactate dehydrogenase
MERIDEIGVIGGGAVGLACLLSVLRGIARDIVVVNRDRKRAKAVVTDLQYGAVLSSFVQIRDGYYPDPSDYGRPRSDSIRVR